MFFCKAHNKSCELFFLRLYTPFHCWKYEKRVRKKELQDIKKTVMQERNISLDPFNWIKCLSFVFFFFFPRHSISCSSINLTNLWTFFMKDFCLFCCLSSHDSAPRTLCECMARRNIEKLFIYRNQFIVTMTLRVEHEEIKREKLFGNHKKISFLEVEWTGRTII